MDNFLTIGLFAVLAVMVFFMFRSSRKRQRDQVELQSKFVVGAEVMTSTGIYGTIVSIDDDKNEAVIETTPGTKIRLHRQAISKVVEPDVDEEIADVDSTDPEFVGATTPDDARELTGEPEFGERTDAATDLDSADDKPVSTAKDKKPRE